MSLLNVPDIPFPSVFAPLTAAPTPLTGIRQNLCATSFWGGLSGHLADPTPNTKTPTTSVGEASRHGIAGGACRGPSVEAPSWRRWQDRVRTLERETFPWIEFGEKIHYRENIKASAGHYLGRWWRTGEAIVGTRAGILRAGTVRLVGVHRWWDLAGLEHVRGLPWQWDPAHGASPRDN